LVEVVPHELAANGPDSARHQLTFAVTLTRDKNKQQTRIKPDFMTSSELEMQAGQNHWPHPETRRRFLRTVNKIQKAILFAPVLAIL
jgi:hypothetical protein